MAAEFFADFLDRLPDKLGLLPAKRVTWREAGPPSTALEREVRHAMIALMKEGRGILVVALKPGFFSSIDGDRVVTCIKEWAAAALEEVVLCHFRDGEFVIAVIDVREEASPEEEVAETAVEPATGDNDPLDIGMEALHMPAIERLIPFVSDLEKVGSYWHSPAEKAMIHFGVAVEHRYQLLPTVAGLITFGTAPARHIPGMRVFLNGRPVEADVLRLLQWAEEHPSFRPFGGSNVRELLLNAIVHRAWGPEARTLPIEIRVSPERLVLSNPGSLRPAPNLLLQRLLRRRGLWEGEGQGLERLRAKHAGAARPGLELSEKEGEVRARLWPLPPPPKPAPPPPSSFRLSGPVRLARPSFIPPDKSVAENTEKTTEVAPTPPAAPRSEVPAAPNLSPPNDLPTTAARPVPRSFPVPAPPPAAPRPVLPPPPKLPSSFQVEASPAPAPTMPADNPAAPRPAHVRGVELLEFVASRGPVTTRMIQEDLGWTRSTTRDVLARLVADGHLRRLAESPRSPEQSYTLP